MQDLWSKVEVRRAVSEGNHTSGGVFVDQDIL